MIVITIAEINWIKTAIVIYLAVGMVVGALIFRGYRKSKRRRAGGKKGKESTALEVVDNLSAERVSSTVITWISIVPHIKLSECLRISATGNNGKPLWAIIRPTSDRKLHLIHCRIGSFIDKAHAGQEGLVSIISNTCAKLRTGGANNFSWELEQRMNRLVEKEFSKERESLMAIQNSASLTEGHELRCLVKGSDLTWDFIKPWDIPTDFAATAEEANSASTTGMAQYAEVAAFALTVARQANVTIQANVSGSPYRLEQKACYVLGPAYGTRMDFVFEQPIGIRIADQGENPKETVELDLILEKLKKMPLAHAFLKEEVSDEGIRTGRLLVIFYNPNPRGRSKTAMAVDKVLFSMPAADGSPVDVLRLTTGQRGTTMGMVQTISLTYLPNNHFSSVAVWQLV